MSDINQHVIMVWHYYKSMQSAIVFIAVMFHLIHDYNSEFGIEEQSFIVMSGVGDKIYAVFNYWSLNFAHRSLLYIFFMMSGSAGAAAAILSA